MRRKKDLTNRISETERLRRISIGFLIVGLAMAITGVVWFPALFILGSTVVIVCTGVASFLTASKWTYSRALSAGKAKPVGLAHEKKCPNCGAIITGKSKYCKRCGKKIQADNR